MKLVDVGDVEKRLIDLQSITGMDYRVIADIALARWMASVESLIETMDMMLVEAKIGDLSRWDVPEGVAGEGDERVDG